MKAILKPKKKTQFARFAQLGIDGLKNTDANSTTNAIICYLNYNGWHVWRNNTYGLYDQQAGRYRKLQYQQKGVSDIIGFNKRTAQMIAVEVKIGADTIRPEQHEFLTQLKKSNGVVFVAKSFDDFLTKYERKAPLPPDGGV